MGSQISSHHPDTTFPTADHDYQGYPRQASQVSSLHPNTPLSTGDHDNQGYPRLATAANMENHGPRQNLQRPNNYNKLINSDEAARIFGGITVTEIYGTCTSTGKPINNKRYYGTG
ncbi:LRR receptor-like serine/threonine-protein kinase FLS2 [Pyrus ussuriensis x Pyrus communis]|uniref:LRR receptor-like serine/threonine-protein kinase FLS2 n=1 Tax=Pyrus ussuriensis x Pyrus communis TaxID=2448454 RepID=A0A5N5FDW4_9ROSA|nr:LRR receptor-like serine/threonine-protein kinase FLS2 [Pyrus ussuriensis x Pyrus communis]